MYDTLTHFYRKGCQPFQSLTVLPEDEALSLMQAFYVPGSVIWERFEDPASYLRERRETEAWLLETFRGKGGRPVQECPVYMILGTSRWLRTHKDPITQATTGEIQLPLAIFGEDDVSFTFPDSMVTRMVVQERNPAYYQPELHGQVFRLREIEDIIRMWDLPDTGPGTNLPEGWAAYIEAQVWNLEPVWRFLSG